MGFTIMESFMDKTEVESVLGLGTKVTMKKTIKSMKLEEELTTL
jgi:stage II sporulation protein AB (anti-sigma F factor)